MTDTAQALAKILSAAPTGAKTYALMDCALDSTLYPTIQASDCSAKCLYTQSWQSGLSDISPYLVELTPGAKFSSELLTWDWYANWGYFAQSAASLDDCAQAFAAVTSVKLPDGTNAFFRFQDPRVIRTFLQTASADDLQTVFGKATRLVVPMADDGTSSEGAIVYTLANGALQQSETRFTG
ncbi:MAG: DUF4123 domain-containing protein [Rhodospirillales bacterium]|nr:DUF4123 domain-containing protein [Rhodospirillales bacterium]